MSSPPLISSISWSADEEQEGYTYNSAADRLFQSQVRSFSFPPNFFLSELKCPNSAQSKGTPRTFVLRRLGRSWSFQRTVHVQLWTEPGLSGCFSLCLRLRRHCA